MCSTHVLKALCPYNTSCSNKSQTLLLLAFDDVGCFRVPMGFLDPLLAPKPIPDLAPLCLPELLLVLDQDFVNVASCLDVVGKQIHSSLFGTEALRKR